VSGNFFRLLEPGCVLDRLRDKGGAHRVLCAIAIEPQLDGAFSERHSIPWVHCDDPVVLVAAAGDPEMEAQPRGGLLAGEW